MIVLGVLALVLTVLALNPTISFWIARRFAGNLPYYQRRPYGMAPVAYAAYMKAVKETKISSARISQTIGNAPLSVGYHKRDGVVEVRGKKYDYTTAVDLEAQDLDRRTLNRFLANLTKNGFACWYREGGKWKFREHIHAVYASLPMKSQLRGQVRLFMRQRRHKGIKPLAWEKAARIALNRASDRR